MKHWTDFVDKIYLIHARQNYPARGLRPDQHENMWYQLEKIGVNPKLEIFEAIIRTKKDDIPLGYRYPKHYGCALSHHAVMKKATSENLQRIMILEDDFYIEDLENFNDQTLQSLEALKTVSRWDRFSFYAKPFRPLEEVSESLYRIHPVLNDHAYIYNANSMATLLQSYNPESPSSDIRDKAKQKDIEDNQYNCLTRVSTHYLYNIKGLDHWYSPPKSTIIQTAMVKS